MSLIGYQASHEQFKPGELVALAVMAEKAGFGPLILLTIFTRGAKGRDKAVMRLPG